MSRSEHSFLHPSSRVVFSIVLASLSILSAIDLMFDLQNEGPSMHVWLEGALVVMSLVVLVFLWRGVLVRLRASAERIVHLQSALEEFRARNEDTLVAMRDAVDDQLHRWQLTTVEAAIAKDLLRGLSLREIAVRRNRSEKTIRNQTAAIYEKTGMTGRADLAAFFLIDVLDQEDD